MKKVSIGRQSATITLHMAIENSTVEWIYELSECDGNTPLHFSVYMKPLVAFVSRIVAGGNDDGSFFLDVTLTNAGSSLKYDKPMNCHRFVSSCG